MIIPSTAPVIAQKYRSAAIQSQGILNIDTMSQENKVKYHCVASSLILSHNERKNYLSTWYIK